MRIVFLFVLFASLATAAPEATKKKGDRKALVFQPGAKVPDAPAAKPAESPVGSPAASTQASPGLPMAIQMQPDVATLLEMFFGLLAKQDVNSAYDLLVRDTVIADRTAEVASLKEKTNEAIRLFGSIKGHEVLSAKKVGENLLRLTCLSLGEQAPLRWKFYFYHARDRWRLIDIRVDDRLVDLFGEKEATTE